MKAIVLAAGKGTRLGDDSNLPKVMRNVGNRPMLSYVLDNLGFLPEEDISIVVGYKKEDVTENIKGNYKYPVQQDISGTGQAVISAKESLGTEEGDVLVCYGDMPLVSRATYEGIIAEHRKSGADCTVLTAIAPKSDLHYGRIYREDREFKSIIEYRDCTEAQKKIHELNAGYYVFRIKTLFEALTYSTRDND